MIALAKVGGGIEALSTPVGKYAGLLLAVVAYLSVGPLFATPRTATVSYKIGIAPLVGGESDISLLIYSVIYFACVIGISLYPGKLLDSVGHVLAPVKMLALAILGVAAVMWPAGDAIMATPEYKEMAFSNGFINGYLTMDTLGAMVFGIVIVNAARSRGVENSSLLTRYTMWAGLIAGVLLTLVYLALFKLGKTADRLSRTLPMVRKFCMSMSSILSVTTAASSGGTDFCGLYGNGDRPDLRLCGILQPLSADFLPYSGVDPRCVLHGDLQPGAEQVDCILHSGAGIHLSAVYCADPAEFHTAFLEKPGRVVAPAMLVSLILGTMGALKGTKMFGPYMPSWIESLPFFKYDWRGLRRHWQCWWFLSWLIA